MPTSRAQRSTANDSVDDVHLIVLEDVVPAPLVEALLNDSSNDMAIAVPSDTLLYIITTSGSTRHPKGVDVSHGNYFSGANARIEALNFEANKLWVLDLASYSFDVSTENMLLTILSGACVCVPNADLLLDDVEAVTNTINVDTMHPTPSVARLLRSERLRDLKVVGLGGKSITLDDIRMWAGKVTLLNSNRPVVCFTSSYDPCLVSLSCGTPKYITQCNLRSDLFPLLSLRFDTNSWHSLPRTQKATIRTERPFYHAFLLW